MNAHAPEVPKQTDSRPRRGFAPLLMRLHFYAGVLVAPFLLVAATTGLLYTSVPQLDRVLYGDIMQVQPRSGQPVPLSEQVQAAAATVPGLQMSRVRVQQDPARATWVTFADPALSGDRERTVYVDPWTGKVTGSLVTWFDSTPVTTTIDDLHRNLLLGDLGRHYSEIAASWLWVLALGGTVLWLRRRRSAQRLRRTLLPEFGARGRRRTLSWHGATGVWLLVGLLFLSATGLTWSRFAGERFQALLEQMGATNPGLDTALSTAGPPDGEPGAHAGHDGGSAPAVDPTDIDTVQSVAAAAGIRAPFDIAAPAPGEAWSVSEKSYSLPMRMDAVAVDPTARAVTATNAWLDRPFLSRVSTIGIGLHMGLFGLLNQLALLTLAIGLICVIVWGYRAWWQRRPRRDGPPVGRLPRRGVWRDVHPPALIVGVLVVIAVAWALPWLGVTLGAFLIVDAIAGALWRRRATTATQQKSTVQREDEAEELLL